MRIAKTKFRNLLIRLILVLQIFMIKNFAPSLYFDVQSLETDNFAYGKNKKAQILKGLSVLIVLGLNVIEDRQFQA